MIRSLTKVRNLLPFGAALLVLLLALWFALFPQFPLVRYKLEKMHADNEKLAEEINRTVASNKLMYTDLAHYRNLRASAMNQPEQTAMVVFREHIETAATAAGLRSRTTGNMRSVTVEQNVLLFDVSFSAEGTLTETVAFLKSIETGTPRFYWRSISLQPGKESLISISGTLCALSFTQNSTPATAPEVPSQSPASPAAPAEKPAEAVQK